MDMVNTLTHRGSPSRETAREICSLIFAIFQGALQSMINLMKGDPRGLWTTSEVPVQHPVESELLLEDNSDSDHISDENLDYVSEENLD